MMNMIQVSSPSNQFVNEPNNFQNATKLKYKKNQHHIKRRKNKRNTYTFKPRSSSNQFKINLPEDAKPAPKPAPQNTLGFRASLGSSLMPKSGKVLRKNTTFVSMNDHD